MEGVRLGPDRVRVAEEVQQPHLGLGHAAEVRSDLLRLPEGPECDGAREFARR